MPLLRRTVLACSLMTVMPGWALAQKSKLYRVGLVSVGGPRYGDPRPPHGKQLCAARVRRGSRYCLRALRC